MQITRLLDVANRAVRARQGAPLQALLALSAALVISAAVIALAGANPLVALHALAAGAFGSAEGWSEVGVRTCPLLLAGLAGERLGDPDGAELFYRKVIEVEPGLAQAHKSLGDVAHARGAHDEALRLYQRAVELEPELGDEVYTRIGTLHYRARNREAAVRAWSRALEMNPKNDVVRNHLDVLRHAGS